MDVLTQAGQGTQDSGHCRRVGHELEADPARVVPDELQRRCRDLGLAVAHEVLSLFWARYGTGDQEAGGARHIWRHPARASVAHPARSHESVLVTVERAYYSCAACRQCWLPVDEASFPKTPSGGAQVDLPALIR
jgi:hypothetical protein